MDLCNELIKNYFSLGLHQQEIIQLLENIHNITVHPRTLKRILKKQHLYRRKHFSNLEEVAAFIEDELGKSGQLHGYRWMHLKCIQQGFTVTQDVIRELLLLLDPQGVAMRKRKRLRRRRYTNGGPNSVWHMDSYDKLKPYGICINGAIDGFSRHIIWLHAGRTSNDPKVIAGYYLNSLKSLGGCPRTIRSDMGTENGTVEKLQTTLRNLFSTNDHQAAFLYGKSTANQRIESWWCNLRKQNAQYWINLFEDLKEEGLFNGTFVDKSLIQFCFLDMIQNELDQLALEWNTHKIRGTRNSRTPVGRPIMMFQVPFLYDAEDKLVVVPQEILNCLDEECLFHNTNCDKDVMELCKELILENEFNADCEDPYDALKLYKKLRIQVYNLL